MNDIVFGSDPIEERIRNAPQCEETYRMIHIVEVADQLATVWTVNKNSMRNLLDIAILN